MPESRRGPRALVVITSGVLALVSTCGLRAQQPPAPTAGDALRDVQEKPSVPQTAPRIDVVPPKRAVKPVSAIKVDVKAFRFTGLREVSEPELQRIVAPFVGPDKSFDDLQGAVEAVSEYLQRRGYFVAQAYLPEQDISGGTVEIAVLEGRIASVRVEMDDTVPVSRHIVEGLLSGLVGGTVLHRDTVERALFLVSDLRGLNVRSIIEPGPEPGTSNLVVRITPGRRVDGLVEFDNHTSRFTGEARLGAGLNINSPFRRGDVLSFRGQLGIPGGGADLDYGRVSYLTPIGNYGTKVGAAYLRVNYHLGTSLFAPLDQSGTSEVVSLYALHPLVRQRNLNIFGQVSHDWRDFHDDRAAVGTASDRTTRVASIGLVGDSRDAVLGGGINNFSLIYTGGRVGIQTPADFLADQSPTGRGIAGGYSRVNGSVARLHTVARNVAVYASYAFQYASKNLDSSEKISLGGPSAVRAYALGEATSDEAQLFSLELRVDLPRINSIPGNTVASVFYDYAHGYLNKDPLPTEVQRNTRKLEGWGLGLTWARQDDFIVRFMLAWRISGAPQSDPADRKPRMLFQGQKFF